MTWSYQTFIGFHRVIPCHHYIEHLFYDCTSTYIIKHRGTLRLYPINLVSISVLSIANLCKHSLSLTHAYTFLSLSSAFIVWRPTNWIPISSRHLLTKAQQYLTYVQLRLGWQSHSQDEGAHMLTQWVWAFNRGFTCITVFLKIFLGIFGL